MNEIEEYLDYLTVRNRRPTTIKSYRIILNICMKELEDNGMETEPDKMGENELWHLIKNMECKEQTVRLYTSVLNNYIMHYTKKDNLKVMKPLWNRPVKNRLCISKEECEMLYDVADPKERMILKLGAGMGLRRAEIWNLRMEDIKGRELIVRGKGHGREGLCVRMTMPEAVCEELKKYLCWRSDNSKDLSQGKLIVYKEKDKIIGYSNVYSIGGAIKNLSEKAGIEVTAHSLRRLFATELRRSNCDIDVISKCMRHSSVQTTSIYIKEDESLQQIAMESMTASLFERCKHINMTETLL